MAQSWWPEMSHQTANLGEPRQQIPCIDGLAAAKQRRLVRLVFRLNSSAFRRFAALRTIVPKARCGDIAPHPK